MQRTQVYFPKEILDELRREAYERRKTLAAVIREKVTKTTKPKTAKPSKSEVAKRLKLLDEISKLNLPTGPWDKMEQTIADAKDPLRFEKK